MKELFPNSATPRLEQYKLAWHALHGTDPEKAAHAKCWLTYRAFDGQVTHEDWKKHVEPIQAYGDIPDRRARWNIAIGAATYYLGIIWDDDVRQKCGLLMVEQADFNLCPSGILSKVRIAAIEAHKHRLNDECQKCAQVIKKAFNRWQHVMGSIRPMARPWRFIEASGDLSALQSLIFTAEAIGILEKPLPDEGWITQQREALTRDKHPWAICLNYLTNKFKP